MWGFSLYLYDHSKDPSNNYINAVFADSFLTRRDLILTQMSMPHTISDFWRLVHDYNVSAIVMLNDPSENDESTAQYWPDSGTPKIFFVQKRWKVPVL